MFEVSSRYYLLDTVTYTGIDGKNISFKRRRFLPNGKKMPLLVELEIKPEDRLDLITSRVLGDGEQFWRVCDANNTNNPQEITAEPGRTIRIPIPQA